MIIILHRHCRELGYCNRGLREWFSRTNLDWQAFLREGLPAEDLRSFDNAMIDRVISLAEREAHGQRQ